mgnify:CR=1 FL=1
MKINKAIKAETRAQLALEAAATEKREFEMDHGSRLEGRCLHVLKNRKTKSCLHNNHE